MSNMTSEDGDAMFEPVGVTTESQQSITVPKTHLQLVKFHFLLSVLLIPVFF